MKLALLTVFITLSALQPADALPFNAKQRSAAMKTLKTVVAKAFAQGRLRGPLCQGSCRLN
jgi:hypothetical protein